jgi:hypothetical protein
MADKTTLADRQPIGDISVSDLFQSFDPKLLTLVDIVPGNNDGSSGDFVETPQGFVWVFISKTHR